MRNILIAALCVFLFIFSYQVRIGFLNTKDFNEPSDANEYTTSARNLNLYLKDIFNNRNLFYGFSKHVIETFNVHGVPLYNIYTTFLSLLNFNPQTIAPVTSSFFVVFLFLVSLAFLPLGISVTLGFLASVYTPLFAPIYSWMPENFTSIIIPVLVIAASILAVSAKSFRRFLLIGIILFLVGFSRNVFMFYGVLFITIYLLIFKEVKKKNALGLILAYVLPLLLWLLIVRWSGTSPYGRGNFQSSVFYANNLKTDGWTLDGVNMTWLGVTKNTLLQNPISLVLLRLERIVRFFKNPANAYSTSFPFSQGGLLLLHTVILFFAAWGIRTIFRNKTLLLIFSSLAWNVFFITSYYLEEVRLQAPTIGLVILLAGLGIREYLHLARTKYLKVPMVILSSLFLIWLFFNFYILGLELAIFPFIKDVGILRIINIITLIFILLYISRKFLNYDRGKISALVPFFIFTLLLASSLRSKIWHEWSTPLSIGQMIEQKIDLSGSQVEEWKKTNGYLLIDMEDANSGRFLSVSLNGFVLEGGLPMYKMRSPVDMLAIRQWQRTLPRLGWGHIEDELRESPAWPNMHQWLVFPIKGDILKNNNTVFVENANYFSSSQPLIFGDYLSFGDRKHYEGPEARIFQGYMHFNKYQIDQDFRLNRKLPLLSKNNISSLRLVDGQMLIDDLSLALGKQTGRYRIFLLFGADPIYLF